MAGTLALAALGVGSAIAAVLALLAQRERRRLLRHLDSAAGELQRLQTAFGRFAPQRVVEGILARGAPSDAERREVTVLFADLVGFTPLSEALDPELLVRVLNDYFARMSAVISDHRGHVAKFIGDGLMALFGALEPNPWQANDAVHAALAMQRTLVEYNAHLRAQRGPELRVGIGIHRGPVIAGVIGSTELLEFTVIGRTVNLAARVERLTRTFDTGILVTAALAQTLDPRFVLEALPARAVRGVAEPVQPYAVRGFTG
jgi:class 3 adenylate cyclase